MLDAPAMEQQQYCLKWNNHPRNIATVFSGLREEELFVDVTIATADKQLIGAHRLVLSAGSGYLEQVLGAATCEHPTILLPTLRYRELKPLLDFMYTGEISVDQPLLEGLLETARWLQIHGLCENVTDATPPTLLEVDEVAAEPTPPASFHNTAPSHVSPSVSQTARKRARSSLRNASSPSADSSTLRFPTRKMARPVVDTHQPESRPEKKSRRERTEEEEQQQQEQDLEEGQQEDNEEEEQKVADEFDQKSFIPDIPSLLNLGGRSGAAGAADFLCHFNADKKLGLLDSPLVGEQMLQAIQLSPYFNHLAALQQQSRCSKTASFTGTFTSFAATGSSAGDERRPTTPDLKASLLGSAPVRRYKQYTEDSLQAALKEIMAGQSINRSSMKHNIPARTLRDWMKRLNIKSVYTHHHPHSGKGGSCDKEGSSVCSSSPEPELTVSLAGYSALFPGLLRASAGAHRHQYTDMEDDDEEEEEEEEEENLKIDESGPDSFQKIAQTAV